MRRLSDASQLLGFGHLLIVPLIQHCSWQVCGFSDEQSKDRSGPKFNLVMNKSQIYLGLIGNMFIIKLGKDFSQSVLKVSESFRFGNVFWSRSLAFYKSNCNKELIATLYQNSFCIIWFIPCVYCQKNYCFLIPISCLFFIYLCNEVQTLTWREEKGQKT